MPLLGNTWQTITFTGNVLASSFLGDGSSLSDISSTLQEITEGGSTSDQIITLTNATNATSKTTGALKLGGGLGAEGDVHATSFHGTSFHGTSFHGDGSSLTGIYVPTTLQEITEGDGASTTDQIITLTNGLNASSKTTGALKLLGGLGVGGDVYATNFYGDGSTDATSGGAGAITTQGGIYAAKKIYAGDDVTAFSDRRQKTNIERIENALDKVCQLSGYTFIHNGERKTGVIAQEVKDVLPEAVYGSEETSYSVAYGNLAGIIIEAIKELKNEIQELKNN